MGFCFIAAIRFFVFGSKRTQNWKAAEEQDIKFSSHLVHQIQDIWREMFAIYSVSGGVVWNLDTFLSVVVRVFLVVIKNERKAF